MVELIIEFFGASRAYFGLATQLNAHNAGTTEIGQRVERSRIAVAGHSWGGQTASMLLGATLPDPDTGATVTFADRRIKAGVLFAVPGKGGDALSEFSASSFHS